MNTYFYGKSEETATKIESMMQLTHIARSFLLQNLLDERSEMRLFDKDWCTVSTRELKQLAI